MRTISVATEGAVDTAVARRICKEVEIEVADVYGECGKQRLDRSLTGYNNAARYWPWFVLRDLDTDANCAPHLRAQLLETLSPRMAFRIVVREIEAWLLADRKSFSEYFRVSQGHVTNDPESVHRPKDHLVSVVRRSRSRKIRDDVVPRDHSNARIGPGYSSRLIDYVQSTWSPMDASDRSESLRRCLDRLSRILVTSE